jgi:hypothetical protein
MNSNAFTAQEIATLTKRLAQLQDEAEDVLRQKLKRKLWGHILTINKCLTAPAARDGSTLGSKLWESHPNKQQMVDASACGVEYSGRWSGPQESISPALGIT